MVCGHGAAQDGHGMVAVLAGGVNGAADVQPGLGDRFAAGPAGDLLLSLDQPHAALGDVVGGPDSVQPDSYVLDDRSWSAEDRVRAVAQTQSDFVVLLGLTRRFERLLDRRHHCSRS
jgi:hypothetical protein